MKSLLVCLVFVSAVFAGNAPEKELAKYLMTTYSELGIAGRPVKKADDTVKVTLSLLPQHILKMEKNSVTIAAMVQMMWNDPFLTWSPEKYDGLKTMLLPAKSIWKPDIVNYNDVHHKPADILEGMETADCLVTYDGSVMWVPRVNYHTICDFEYNEEADDDYLVCPFTIGSWAQDSLRLDVFFDKDKADFDMAWYRPSPFVDVVSHSAEKQYVTYDAVPDNKYPALIYTMTIRKAPKGSYFTKDTCKNGEQCSAKH